MIAKIQKWFHAYKRFRYEFNSLDEFIVWYNNRRQVVWISIISNLQN
ncbi:MAG: hypothetical protein WC593_12055 [Methanoregula sp.]